MGRIKIEDLPREQKISIDEMRRVAGGSLPVPMLGLWSGLGGSLLADPRPSPLVGPNYVK